MKTVECIGIKKFFPECEGKTEALRGIDLVIFEKTLTLLVGPSGSGKTTLLSILETILTPDEGDLFILGNHVNKMSEFEKANLRNKNIGVVFQALHLIPTLTILENVILPLTIKGEDKFPSQKKGLSLLSRLGIKNKINSFPSQLSIGEQERAAIARALINDPKIILCDEPTGSLDQANGHAFMSILRDLVSLESRTVLVVTHDNRIFSFADHILNINDGIIGEKIG